MCVRVLGRGRERGVEIEKRGGERERDGGKAGRGGGGVESVWSEISGM